jgi:hypothetical protein
MLLTWPPWHSTKSCAAEEAAGSDIASLGYFNSASFLRSNLGGTSASESPAHYVHAKKGGRRLANKETFFSLYPN